MRLVLFPASLFLGLAVVKPTQAQLVACQGAQHVHHDPGLLTTPRPNYVNIGVDLKCISPDMDPNLATISLHQSFGVNSACNRIHFNFVNNAEFTWTNGSTSLATMTANTVVVGGNRVVQSVGNVTHGLFMGYGISQIEVLPIFNFLQCAFDGVTDYSGPTVINIFPPGQMVTPPTIPV